MPWGDLQFVFDLIDPRQSGHSLDQFDAVVFGRKWCDALGMPMSAHARHRPAQSFRHYRIGCAPQQSLFVHCPRMS